VRLPVGRTEQRDDLALVAPVDAEVLKVDGNDAMAWKLFAHSDQTQIGEVDVAVGMTIRQRSQSPQRPGGLC
jgi:hypothetical protein